MIPTKTTLKSAQSNRAATGTLTSALPAVPPSSHQAENSALPVTKPTAELTPKAQAKASNQLPGAEQMSNFEEHLEEKDSGNRPA
jgi:hypothetical protein